MKNLLKNTLINLEREMKDEKIFVRKSSEGYKTVQTTVSNKELKAMREQLEDLNIEGLYMSSEPLSYGVGILLTFTFKDGIYKCPRLSDEEIEYEIKKKKEEIEDIKSSCLKVVLSNNIEKLLNEKKMTITSLSEEIGLTYRATHSLVKSEDLSNVKAKTLALTAKALDVDVEDLYSVEYK